MTFLTTEDRCDRCGAQAYVAVAVAGLPLLFCAHHHREHADALKGMPVLVDDRHALEPSNA